MKKVCLPLLRIGAALLACLLVTHLNAQDDPTPKEPLISRAPDKSAWTITYRYKQSSSEAKPSPVAKQPEQITTVQVQKTGKIYHRVITWVSGSKTDSWTVGQRQITKDKSAPSYVLMPNEGPATDDYTRSDFEDLSWISMKFYTGFKKGEQPVFVFQTKNTDRPITRREKFNPLFMHLLQSTSTDGKTHASTPAAGSSPADIKSILEQIYGDTVATVVLDANTQLPIAYDDGKTIWAYQFTTAPADTLAPPPDVVKILRRFDDYVKGTTVRPSTP